MTWNVEIRVHDDGSPPGANRSVQTYARDELFLSDAVEGALDDAMLIHEEPGTRQFQITCTSMRREVESS